MEESPAMGPISLETSPWQASVLIATAQWTHRRLISEALLEGTGCIRRFQGVTAPDATVAHVKM
jgi:hypothetical protein